jgi:dTDP-4-amino-4,6-dideoxygalactose transaminase
MLESASHPTARTAPQSTIQPVSEGEGCGKPSLFPFVDLKAQYATIRDEVMQAVTRVMESQGFILGPEVQAFENEIARYVGVRFAVGCASGTDALILALLALNIGPGDEVITTPFTFVATAGAVARAGATPVFVDIDPETFNIDPESIKPAITPRTRAIIPVHLFGLASDMDPVLKLAAAHKLAVIEDVAQAIGAKYKNAHLGALGTFGCFSFFPSKNLGGAGDGGLVTTTDAGLAERVRAMRVHGSRKKYYCEMLGTNSRLDALQAAILRVKLGHLDSWTVARRRNAERYWTLGARYGLERFIKIPLAPADCYHVFNQFTIRSAQRDQLQEFLRARGIPTEIYYPHPLHLQPAFSYLGYREGQFPKSEAASREVLSLPIYPELSEEQQMKVISTIADFFGAAN